MDISHVFPSDRDVPLTAIIVCLSITLAIIVLSIRMNDPIVLGVAIVFVLSAFGVIQYFDNKEMKQQLEASHDASREALFTYGIILESEEAYDVITEADSKVEPHNLITAEDDGASAFYKIDVKDGRLTVYKLAHVEEGKQEYVEVKPHQ